MSFHHSVLHVALETALKCGLIVRNPADAYRKYFDHHYPAATAVQVGSLVSPEILLEVEAIAVIE